MTTVEAERRVLEAASAERCGLEDDLSQRGAGASVAP
jgi:hypothetical protein